MLLLLVVWLSPVFSVFSLLLLLSESYGVFVVAAV
jgi:hypothetical protein